MPDDVILHRFDDLSIWKQGAQRAPHKPLLVLYALGPWQQGQAEVTFREAEPDLTAPDDWLRSIEANPLVRRAERTVAADPSRNGLTTKVSGSGKCVVRKIVYERDD